MALTFQPFGFSLYEFLGGKPNYSLINIPISLQPNTTPTSEIGINGSYGQGDLMSLESDSGEVYSGLIAYPFNPQTNGANTQVAGYSVQGVVDGFEYTATNGTTVLSNYWAAGTATFQNKAPFVKINPLADCVFMAQCNAPLPANGAYGRNCYVSGNGVAASVGSGTTANITPANPQTGQSTQFVDVTHYAGVNNLNGTIKIIGLAPPNAASPLLATNNWNDPYPVILCRINQHFFSAPTPSVV